MLFLWWVRWLRSTGPPRPSAAVLGLRLITGFRCGQIPISCGNLEGAANPVRGAGLSRTRIQDRCHQQMTR